MVRPAVTIAVEDVRASTGWYGRLLDCPSPLDPDHEHRALFDVLSDDAGGPVLFLTRWDHHPLAPLRDAASGRPGHGVVLFFEVDDVESSWARAVELDAEVVDEPHESRGFEVTEFTVLDPDGYHVSVSEPVDV